MNSCANSSVELIGCSMGNSKSPVASRKLSMDYIQMNFKLNECHRRRSSILSPATSQSSLSNYSESNSPSPVQCRKNYGRRYSFTYGGDISGDLKMAQKRVTSDSYNNIEFRNSVREAKVF